MNDKLDVLLGKIKDLEKEVLSEIQKKEERFSYEIHARKVRFKETVTVRHRELAKQITRYLYEAKPFSLFSAPMILFCLVPVLFLDVVAELYQFICFPVYGIPKVRRKDYVVMDRSRLAYLNPIEKWNCVYCEYVNGLLAYVQEIAGRTEQYWCPIKHALHLKVRHSRYGHFLDFGDAEQYRARIEAVRRDFADLKAQDAPVRKV